MSAKTHGERDKFAGFKPARLLNEVISKMLGHLLFWCLPSSRNRRPDGAKTS